MKKSFTSLSLALVLAGCGLGEVGRESPASRVETGEKAPPHAGSATRETKAPAGNVEDDGAPDSRVVLVRAGDQGVPLHASREPHAKFSRVPSGSRATILGAPDESKLLHVRLDSGEEGYVALRYVERSAATKPPGENPPLREDVTVRSREACERSFREKKPDASETVRVGTFNVRWFPDGGPGEDGEKRTDVAWLACVLASTGSDAIALQEWKLTSRAKKATDELLAALASLGGSRWEIEIDDCSDRGAQHVGILWNTARVRLENFRVVGAFNPKGGACEGRLRPGLVGRVVPKVGRPFDFGSLHLKSGTDRSSYELRSKSFEAIRIFAKESSVPLVLAGDLNTMGCQDCVPAIDEREERRTRDLVVEASSGALVPDAPSCSHYYEGRPGLLDGFMVWGMASPSPKVFGECAARSCAKGARSAPYFGHVSDHCPLAVDLARD